MVSQRENPKLWLLQTKVIFSDAAGVSATIQKNFLPDSQKRYLDVKYHLWPKLGHERKFGSLNRSLANSNGGLKWPKLVLQTENLINNWVTMGKRVA